MTKQIRLLLFVLSFFSITMVTGQESTAQDTIKKVTFAGIPILNYSTSIGFIAGGMGSMYYKLNSKDTISPSSFSMLIGIYSTSKTWFIGAVQKFYFDEDKWRLRLILGKGDLFFQYFAAHEGQYFDDGQWIKFNTTQQGFQFNLQRKILPFSYFGVEGTINNAETKYDITDPNTGEAVTSRSDMNSLGYNLLFDSRDDVNTPISGYFIEFKNNFIREAFGSTGEFDQYKIAANYFWDVKKDKKTIVVPRIYAIIASGDVPFEGQNFIGGDDLRGYSKGEFRADHVYATQVEVRQNIYKKFGMVGFLGAGVAVDEFSEISKAQVAPSIGFGFRYLFIPKEKLNIGVDVGFGRDDWSLTFRISEAFGR